ncbi:hypothetical protein [Cylindrospermum stagnale]|uniref:hypothetical protein n=1 Tax=Cylindrospermum stagnale TaxID=142864 RepID=UPI00059C55D7|nr:hypothetical protein [Cylindrospermum stagnale]
MVSSEDIYQQYPSAIEPIYWTGKPNEPINQDIELYSCSLEIVQEGNTYTEHGKVYFKWLPYPDIKFEFSNSISSPLPILGKEISLNITEIGASAKGFLSRLYKISGVVDNPVVLDSGHNLSYILFHLTNFHEFTGSYVSTKNKEWCKRLTLEAEGWRVSIDSVGNLQNIMEFLQSQGGYAITHVGKLERS